MLAQRVSAGAGTSEVRQVLSAAESDSRWRDPVELAGFLVKDWPTLTNERRRTAVLQLVERITVRTGDQKASITVRTRWGSTSSYTGASPHPFRCETGAQGGDWLRTDEAISLMGCTGETLRGWRNYGLLPLTQLSEPGRYIYYYARSDLERILTAPRRDNRGVDRGALKAAIERGSWLSPA